MGWLSRLKARTTHDFVGRVDDEELGPLVLNEGCWEARVTVRDRPVCFKIGGRHQPDPTLVAHARHILTTFDRFEALVAEFVAREAGRPEWSPFADEIRALAIRDICLFWPDRPDDGMVFFDGPDQWRYWRCDVIGRVPVGLGFDS